jgi:hypothetical protein
MSDLSPALSPNAAGRLEDPADRNGRIVLRSNRSSDALAGIGPVTLVA